MRLPSILNLRGSTQSALLKRNILASFMLKGVSILISFFIVPLTIDFVNPTQRSEERRVGKECRL